MADWFWPVSEAEAQYIEETGLALCFPPGKPIEVRVISDSEEAQWTPES